MLWASEVIQADDVMVVLGEANDIDHLVQKTKLKLAVICFD